MNGNIPHRSPFVTIFVCNPWYVPSRTVSRHHWIIVKIVITLPVNSYSWFYWWNHLVILDAVTRAPIALVSGQSLCSTKQNGWFLCLAVPLLIVGFCVNHTKHISTLCGQNAQFIYVKASCGNQRQELPSPAKELWSWVRIELEAWCLCVYSVLVMCCV
jgi:hypothetical protein